MAGCHSDAIKACTRCGLFAFYRPQKIALAVQKQAWEVIAISHERAFHNQRLSEHFWRREFMCPDSGRAGVDWLLIERLEALSAWANHVDTKREHGLYVERHIPVIITTKYGAAGGFRSEACNERIGGAKESYHLQGRAADWHIPGIPLLDAYQWWNKTFPDTGLAIYPDNNFIHTDIRGYRARW